MKNYTKIKEQNIAMKSMLLE